MAQQVVRFGVRCLEEPQSCGCCRIGRSQCSARGLLLAQLARAGATEKEDGGREMAVATDDLHRPDRQRSGRGIVAGGSLCLAGLDRAMMTRQRGGKLVCYVRYMDDIVILTETRWQLRRAIAHLHAILLPLHLRLHRVKRFTWKTSRDFDFLGYRLHDVGGDSGILDKAQRHE